MEIVLDPSEEDGIYPIYLDKTKLIHCMVRAHGVLEELKKKNKEIYKDLAVATRVLYCAEVAGGEELSDIKDLRNHLDQTDLKDFVLPEIWLDTGEYSDWCVSWISTYLMARRTGRSMVECAKIEEGQEENGGKEEGKAEKESKKSTVNKEDRCHEEVGDEKADIKDECSEQYGDYDDEGFRGVFKPPWSKYIMEKVIEVNRYVKKKRIALDEKYFKDKHEQMKKNKRRRKGKKEKAQAEMLKMVTRPMTYSSRSALTPPQATATCTLSPSTVDKVPFASLDDVKVLAPKEQEVSLLPSSDSVVNPNMQGNDSVSSNEIYRKIIALSLWQLNGKKDIVSSNETYLNRSAVDTMIGNNESVSSKETNFHNPGYYAECESDHIGLSKGKGHRREGLANIAE